MSVNRTKLLLKTVESEGVQRDGYVFHDTSGPNHGQTLKILWFPSNEIHTDTPLAGLSCERHFEEASINLWVGESTKL